MLNIINKLQWTWNILFITIYMPGILRQGIEKNEDLGKTKTCNLRSKKPKRRRTHVLLVQVNCLLQATEAPSMINYEVLRFFFPYSMPGA